MPTFKIYDGSAFGSPTAPKVYNGATWDTPVMKYYDGTSWQTLTFLGDIGGLTPSVSDIYLTNTVASGAVNVGIYFNETTVGAIYNLVMRHNAVYAVMGTDDTVAAGVDHTGEWTDDTGVVGSEWEVACTSITSGGWTTHLESPAAATGVYVDLSVLRGWKVRRAGAKSYVAGTTQVVAQFRLREVADTANFVDFQVTCIGVQT